jgi:aldose 1-epimerase
VSALISSQILQLSSADGLWRAQISPVGASLVGLWHGDVEVVASPYDEPLTALAGAVMAPWPNRLEDGIWKLGNREFAAAINDADGNNANHGLAFDKAFDIVTQTESLLRLETKIFDELAYPFEVLLTVTYALENDGLHISFAALNQAAEAAPFAFGLHPYFVSDEDSELELNALTWIQKNSRNLPTHSSPIDSSSAAQQGRNRIAELNIDDCFTDLVANERGYFVTTISRPSSAVVVEIEQSRALKYLMLYKLQEVEKKKRMLLAVEPQSSKANFLRNLEGETLLQPNQALEATCQIKLRKTS